MDARFPFAALGVVALFATLVMLAAWARQRVTNNAGIVDVVWAAALAVAAIYYAVVLPGAREPRIAIGLMGGLWGARLALHLWKRVGSEPEDGRYRYLREHWNGDQTKFLGFFLFQAALVAMFSLPFLAAATNPVAGATPWLVAGVVVWLASLAGESIADAQLAAWRHDPANRGRTCRAGLWRYSRHPNYFFEWLHWFGYALVAVGSPWAWLAWLGPVLMGASLVWVTGIPFTEAQALRSRGDDYRAYQRETSAFFPWFPRKTSDADRS